ncbi:exopolysaccharide production protein [Rathayibacter sp. YIM 133350]|uniref:O-antigen ligase family protein n=1 Tax=Rathayibacter sp. YIM 133350 TaxID=3131992 RepID=UPI00307DEA25
MAEKPRPPLIPSAAQAFLGSAGLASAITTAVFLTAFSTFAIRSVIEWPGLVAIVGGLMLAAAASLWFRREHIGWHGAIPISVIVFVGWAIASVFWTNNVPVSGVRILYLLGFGFLGFYAATVRDTIQIVRAAGDAFRVLLGASLVLEVLSGLLIDMPIRFLGIEGNLARLGPLQGIFGSRNQLGFISLIALISFGIEYLTRSVPRQLARYSLVVAAVCLLMSRSPVIIGVLTAVVVAALALAAVRRAKPHNRWALQLGLLGVLIVGGAIAWIARARIIDVLNAGSEFETRLTLWREMARYLATNPLQGWGWVGAWPRTPPYAWLNLATHRLNGTGLDAFIDVFFQLGLVGFIAFLALFGLALVRSWLLASEKRSIIYVWPALILVALASVSLAESTVLFEGGWMLLVICAVKASRNMSWRDALRRHPDPVPVE